MLRSLLIAFSSAAGLNFPKVTLNSFGAEEAAPAAFAAGFDPLVVSHAFVQTGNELLYFRDISQLEIRQSVAESAATAPSWPKSDLTSAYYSAVAAKTFVAAGTTDSATLFFVETFTDFGAVLLGFSETRRIRLVNGGTQKIYLSAIISSAPNFYCSYFNQQTLEPSQSTYFDVLFFPTVEGLVEDRLFVHTSVGEFSHRVRGIVSHNPYGIQPQTDIRLPLNATFTLPLVLYNPNQFVLHVQKAASSDPNVHLELFHDPLVRTGRAKLWKLAPFERKAIGNVKILGNSERNSSVFFYVKMRYEKEISKKVDLVIPFYYQVMKSRGLFSAEATLDFGLIKEGVGSTEALRFHVYTNLETGVDIESISARLSTPDSEDEDDLAINVHLLANMSIPLKCGARHQPGAPVALADLRVVPTATIPPLATSDDQPASGKITARLHTHRGTIVAVSRGGNYNLIVPYVATLYRGELIHNREEVSFHRQLQKGVSRTVQLTNLFPFGLALWNVSLSRNAHGFFKANLLNAILEIAPQQTLPAIQLNYLKSPLSGANFSAICTLQTNLSSFEIPIEVFDGKINIQIHSTNRRVFDFGWVGGGERRTILFSIHNPNPVAVYLRRFDAPFRVQTHLGISVQMNGNRNPNAEVQQSIKTWIRGEDYVLPANGLVNFNYTLWQKRAFNPSDVRETKPLKKSFRIQTDFEHFEFPVQFRPLAFNQTVIPIPEVLRFAGSFIGTAQWKILKVLNFLHEDLRLERVWIAKEDPRFQFRNWFSTDATVSSEKLIRGGGKLTSLGEVSFFPEADGCAQNGSLKKKPQLLFGHFAQLHRWPMVCLWTEIAAKFS